MTDIDNLVFEGGGVNCSAYVGVLKALEELGILQKVKRIAATSGGGITALFVGLGCSASEIAEEYSKLSIKAFKDSSSMPLLAAYQVLRYLGLYPGSVCLNWLEELVLRKTGSRFTTFAELYTLSLVPGSSFRPIYLQVGNMSTRMNETFSHEKAEFASWPLALATRASMSIPGFFRPVRDHYIDGGFVVNYPISTFDNLKYIKNNTLDSWRLNRATLGFRVDDLKQNDIYKGLAPAPEHTIDSFFSMMAALFEMSLNTQDNIHFNSVDTLRSVYIDTKGLSSIDFDITAENRAILIDSGYQATIAYAHDSLRKNQLALKYAAKRVAQTTFAPGPHPHRRSASLLFQFPSQAGMIPMSVAVDPNQMPDNINLLTPKSSSVAMSPQAPESSIEPIVQAVTSMPDSSKNGGAESSNDRLGAEFAQANGASVNSDPFVDVYQEARRLAMAP